MSAATVCVFRTWKIEGCAGFGRRPLRSLGLFVVPRRSGVLLRSLTSCSALPGGTSDSACALLSATCLSAAVAALLSAWADAEGTKQGVPIIAFFPPQFDLQSRKKKNEKKTLLPPLSWQRESLQMIRTDV